MYVTEVNALFYELTDEQDQSFLKPSQVQRYLRQGYDEFRRVVANYDPNVFTANATLNLSGVSSYDLALGTNPVRLSGPNPTQAAMQRLTQVLSIDPSSGRVKWCWSGVKTEGELNYDIGVPSYMLAGDTLNFGRVITDTLRLVYVPAGSKPRNPTGVDWSKTASTDTEFIDSLDEFHDMIAMYAYGIYAARDGADNVQVDKLLMRRIASLQAYLFGGRDSNAAGHSSNSY